MVGTPPTAGFVCYQIYLYCPFTPRGYPSPRFFLRSLVPGPFGGFLSPRWAGTPVPGRGVPPARKGVSSLGRTGLGYPLTRTGLGYPPARTELGYPLARTGLGPPLAGTGVPPPQDITAERALATRWAVCLLRSRRGTFLFLILLSQLTPEIS